MWMLSRSLAHSDAGAMGQDGHRQDRGSEEMDGVVPAIRLAELKVYAYANNHYAGHGPGTVKVFWDLFEKK
jgi:uncharacterized protein YecE (DUF72 family)